jgi:hypothetical protein
MSFLFLIHFYYLGYHFYQLLFDDKGYGCIDNHANGAKRYEPIEARLEKRKSQTVKKQYVS